MKMSYKGLSDIQIDFIKIQIKMCSFNSSIGLFYVELWSCGSVEPVDPRSLWICGACGSVEPVDPVDLWSLWIHGACGSMEPWIPGAQDLQSPGSMEPVDLWSLGSVEPGICGASHIGVIYYDSQ